MNSPHAKAYCSPDKGGDYYRLLQFATISETDDQLSVPKNQDAALGILNALNDNLLPALHPILPLIYNKLNKAVPAAQLQPEAKNLLRRHTMSLMGMDLINQKWLAETFSLFHQESLPVILLKSSAFSRNLYPVHAPRMGVDIDLLVTEDTFTAACNLLSTSMKPVLPDNNRMATYNTLFERSYLPRQGSIPMVEIHRALTNPHIFSIDEQTLWAGSRKHPAYDSELIRILSPEDTLLHLAVHAFRDLNFCTHNLLDMHEIWCQWKPDPKLLLEKAQRWGAKQVLYYLLKNSRIVMNTPIPETLLTSLQPNRVNNAITKKILRIVTQDYQSNNNFRYRITQLISQLLFPDRLSGGLKYQAHYIQTRMKDWFMTKRDKET